MNRAWRARSEVPALEPKTIHVWRVPLRAHSELVESRARTLSEDEHERSSRFRAELDRRRFVLCRGTLRVLLGSYTSRDPASLQFEYADTGKPSLMGDEHLAFNVSHSDELALIAVSRTLRIGVDLERHRDIDYCQLASRFFAESEQTQIASAEGSEQRDSFFACWTRKEAYLKGTGRGISLPLDRFEVSVQGPAALIRDEDEPDAQNRWTLETLFPASGYSGALAVDGGFDSIELCDLPEGE